jgi:predicted MPP superfamily phosphohydrolase
VNGLKPDIVALTGDYVVNSPRYIGPVVEALATLRPAIAIVGVLGNHDWWEGGLALKDSLTDNGIVLLDNHRVVLTPDRQIIDEATEGLCLAGVGDPWADKVDFDAALEGIAADMPCILLSHNPDTAEDKRLLEARYRIDLMLSGHTHGGQVCFPKNGQPVLPKIRKHKYARGLVFGPQCPVYISRGIGTAGVPLRLGADPEIAVFDLVSATGPMPFVRVEPGASSPTV